MSIYSEGLSKNDANFTQLSPISLLRRAAFVYPDRAAVVYGEVLRRSGRIRRSAFHATSWRDPSRSPTGP